MSTIMAEQDTELATRQQFLESRVLLLAPSFSYWRGMYQIPSKNLKISIAGSEIDNESVTVNRAVLLHDKWPCDPQGTPWKKRLQTIESKQKACIEKYSVSFPIRGVRIIPKRAGAQFFQELFGLTVSGMQKRIENTQDYGRRSRYEQALREFLNENQHAGNSTPMPDPELKDDEQSVAYKLYLAARVFANTLPDILRQIREKLDPTVWTSIESKIPKSAQFMRSKFRMDVTPVELAGTDGGNKLSVEDLHDHASIVQEACRRKVEEAIEEMVRGPRAQLGDALASLHQLIQDDGRVTARSFAPVRAAIEKIRLFDCVADDQLMAAIQTIERRLDTTAPGDLTSTNAAANGFSNALTSLMTEVNNADAIARTTEHFGRPARDINID